MKWVKLGRIFDLDSFSLPEWMSSHASVPFVDKTKDGRLKVYFSSRDKKNCSNIGSFYLDIDSNYEVSEISQEQLLKPGEPGVFDDSGIMGTCILDDDNEKKLYYIGWNLGVTVPFRNAIGLAVSDDDGASFCKKFEGAVLDRTAKEPNFSASCCVIKEDGVYKIWYLSCVKWEVSENDKKHHYHIKYAESENGIDWMRDGQIAIDFESEYEYAISVPRVLKINNKYHMWFSSRATKEVDTYRIRYATSVDGVSWVRKKEFEMDVSESGWDSDMVCYPSVFYHRDELYMLYNGNGYGESGIGLAKLSGDVNL